MTGPDPCGDAAARADGTTVLDACVAHDVNNMLAVVLACADVLARHIPPDTIAAGTLRDLHIAAERATDLIRQWMSVGRRDHPRPQRLDLAAVVDEIAPILRILAGREADLHVVAAEGLWPVRADRGRVAEIVMNLVTNARDAIDGSGTVHVDSANVDIATGPHVLLRVRDSGRGMDGATMARVFEPFFTTKERGKGSGLGLAIVRALVDEMGGVVRVTSHPGEGSTFNVYLPRDGDSESP